jgi:hypothetical protein
LKFLDALHGAVIASNAKVLCQPAATIENWRAECVKVGLIEPHDKPNTQRALFAKYKLALITANRIACNETMAWLVK